MVISNCCPSQGTHTIYLYTQTWASLVSLGDCGRKLEWPQKKYPKAEQTKLKNKVWVVQDELLQ